nr:unnamed protein product [Callosobruchus analis]
MGHAEKIHKDYYRLPIAKREITRMSRLLEKAQGGNESDQSDDENYGTTDAVHDMGNIFLF